MNSLVAIVGPTGVGKSRLALSLARAFHGEIVNADSRQIYRYLDIGTAKPTPEELSLVPHHLIDIINPDEDFSLAQYQKLAYQTIDNIQRENKLPFLVGGSGLYIRAVIEGWRIPEVPPDTRLRQALEERAAEIGAAGLFQELLEVDPAAAEKIDPRNIRRVIRALEVQQKTNRLFSELQRKEPPPYHTYIIGLTAERDELYRRVDRRIDEMIAGGLVTEVEILRQMGYDFKLSAMSSIGYRQIVQFLNGALTLEAAIQQIKTETHRLVRHQYAWFRRKDPGIHWFDIEKDVENTIRESLAEFMELEQENHQ
ncbi:tRNA (adenosine(37)-N6)-dimethylallyltransferase MiaA [Chloroflexota bacterium]